MTRKRWAAGIAATVLTVSALAGCGSAGSSDAGGCKGGNIKIGLVGPFTGPYAVQGQVLESGAQAAIKAFEEKHSKGLLGCKIVLVKGDDQFDPAKSLSAVKNLVEREGVKMILSGQNSSSMLATSPYTTQRKQFVFGYATNPDLYVTSKYPYNFADGITAKPVGEGMTAAAEQIGYKSAAILTEDSAFGEGIRNSAGAALKDAGISVASNQVYPTDASNYDTYALKAKANGADFIMACGQEQTLGRLMQSRKKVGNELPVILCNTAANANFLPAAAGTTPLDTVSVGVNPPYWREDVANVKAFHTAYESLGKPFDNSLPYHFTGLLAWMTAVDEAKSLDADKVLAKLEKFSDWSGGASNPITFTKDSHLAVKDGSQVEPIFLVNTDKVQCTTAKDSLTFCDAKTLRESGLKVPFDYPSQ
jgi:branched-chain amino acid transport system substrate-binding protein